MSDKLTGALQENLLTLLCFSAKSATLIRNAVEPELFSSPLYREIVARVVDFLDRHKAPCGEHLPDLLEDILNRKDQEAELAERLVVSVLQMQGKVNEDYVVSQLEDSSVDSASKRRLSQHRNCFRRATLSKPRLSWTRGCARACNYSRPA